MFRNVIGVQEAVVHRQSDDSLSHENKQIKDIQSDDIVQTYSALKTKWFYQREHLIEYLKTLQKHQTYSSEIQHVQSLLECLNELIENGEITKNCQTLIHDNIHFFPQTYILTRKPLGNKLIRLPRHVSKPIIHLSNSLEKISSEIIHLQRSNEKLKHQIDHHINIKQIDETSDSNETTTSTGKMKNGIQFYVVAEQFRNQSDKKPKKKHHITSTIME